MKNFFNGIGGLFILLALACFSIEAITAAVVFIILAVIIILLANPDVVATHIELKKLEKEVANEKAFIRNNTAKEVVEYIRCKVVSKNKITTSNVDSYEVSIKKLTTGEFHLLTGYESYMKCCEGQELSVEFEIKSDKDGNILQEKILNVIYS